jgi:hypothetical protein
MKLAVAKTVYGYQVVAIRGKFNLNVQGLVRPQRPQLKNVFICGHGKNSVPSL